MKKNIGFWDRLFMIGTQKLPLHGLQRKISGRVNQLAVYMALINLVIGLPAYFFITHSTPLLLGVVTEILLCIFPLYLNYRGSYTRASQVLFLILCGATFYFCSLLGSLAKVELMVLVLWFAARSIFTSRWMRWFSYVTAVVIYIAVRLNAKYIWIHELKIDRLARTALYYAAYAVAMFLIITVVCWFGQLLERRKRTGEQPITSNSGISL